MRDESAPGPHEWLSIRPRGGMTLVHWTPRYDLFGEPARGGVRMDGRDWVLAAEADGAGRQGGLLVFESFDDGDLEVGVSRGWR